MEENRSREIEERETSSFTLGVSSLMTKYDCDFCYTTSELLGSQTRKTGVTRGTEKGLVTTTLTWTRKSQTEDFLGPTRSPRVSTFRDCLGPGTRSTVHDFREDHSVGPKEKDPHTGIPHKRGLSFSDLPYIRSVGSRGYLSTSNYSEIF